MKSILLFTTHTCNLLFQCNRKADGQHGSSQMAAELNESAPVMLDSYTCFEEASVTDQNHFFVTLFST